jgi:RNA polymerase sigma factor (sigma-70 family)
MPRKSRLQPLARAVLRTQTDDRLVTLARDGKEAAFEEIVRRYRVGLVAFAAAYGPPDPEDVVQESLVRSWEALRDSTGEMHLKAWLYTIVRNRALNARRDARPHEPLAEDIDGVRQPAEIVLTNEELRRTVAAVGALPDQQREALVRSALEGHTHDQIAAAIGSTPGAVRQLIYRARMTVRHGVGLVIPLPLVAALAEAGGGGAGAVAGGAAAAGTAGGASLATKAAVVAAIGVVAAGSGAVIQRSHDSKQAAGNQATVADADRGRGPGSDQGRATASSPATTTTEVGDDSGSRGEGRSGDLGQGDEGSDSSGPGPGSSAGDDSSGPSSQSGPGPGGSSDDSSGPGSGSPGSGSGDSHGDSSGPGGDGPEAEPPKPPDSDSSGPGSDSSGPGSDSSGPGSGDATTPEIDSSGPGGGGSDDLPEPPELD